MSLDVRVYNHTVTWLARDAGRPFVVRSDPKCGCTWHSGLTECFSCVQWLPSYVRKWIRTHTHTHKPGNVLLYEGGEGKKKEGEGRRKVRGEGGERKRGKFKYNNLVISWMWESLKCQGHYKQTFVENMQLQTALRTVSAYLGLISAV